MGIFESEYGGNPDPGADYLDDENDSYDGADADDDDWHDSEDQFEEALQDCGWLPDEDMCMSAGSEYCEFHCSLRKLFENELIIDPDDTVDLHLPHEDDIGGAPQPPAADDIPW